MKRLLLVAAALALLAGWTAARQGEAESARIVPAAVLSTVEAVYPFNSIAQGTVVLEVTLDTQGQVEAVRVVKDIKSLTPEAEKAVRKWSFAPATLGGRPVPAKVTVAFNFRTFVFPY